MKRPNGQAEGRGAGARREIVGRLQQTSKYRHLSEETLYRTAGWASVRHPVLRDAVKAAKRKLHQACGAYLVQAEFSRVAELIRPLSRSTPEDELRAVCRKVMACHASTEERTSIVEDFYSTLFRETGPPRSVLDLACGLNPFALPWMGLPADAAYHAQDADDRLISAVNRFFIQMGRPPAAECGDVLVSPMDVEVDVAFLLKALPCLEQQEKGAGERLLRGLRAQNAVVSFPSRSLSGKDRGMARHHDGFMAGLLDRLGIPAFRVAYPSEVFYVCRLKERAA